MGGVGEKLSFALVRGADPGQQRVQGVPEPGDLVVASRVHRKHRRCIGALGRAAVPLHRGQCCAGNAVPDQGCGEQGGQVGDDELEQQLTQRFVVLASADRRGDDDHARRRAHLGGDDAVGPVAGRDHAAHVLADRLAGPHARDRLDVGQTCLGVAADDAAAPVVDLVGLAGGVGRRGGAGGQVPRDHCVVGVQVLVELTVQRELDAPVHERTGQHQDHRHGGGHGQHQPGHDGTVAEQAAPHAHERLAARLIASRSRGGSRRRAASGC